MLVHSIESCPTEPPDPAAVGARTDEHAATTPVLRRVPMCEPAYENSHGGATVVVAPVRTRRRATTPAVCPRPNPVSPTALVRAQQVFRLTFEVLEGRRGPNQLQQLLTPELVAKVTTLARECAGRRARSTARLNRVHVQQVTPRAAEACVTVARGAKVHAVAARMELDRHGWRCTALRIG